MSRCFILACVGLLLSHIEPARALADVFAIIGPNDSKTELAVDAGKVRLIEPPSNAVMDWDLTLFGKETKTTIQVSKGKWGQWYLTYPVDGMQPKVYLRQKSGAHWKLTRVALVAQFTIQATRGKFKGWYLAEGEGGKVVLVKKPKRPPIFEISTVGP